MLKKTIAIILVLSFVVCIAAGCAKEDETGNKRPLAERLENLPYTKYLELTGEEQQEFMESFESPEAFVDWYNQAKDLYMAILEEG